MSLRRKGIGQTVDKRIIENETIANTVSDFADNIVSFKKPATSSFPQVPEFAITLSQAKRRMDALKKFIDEMMIPGVDYAILPGASKPTLLKSGGEKLCDAFSFSRRVEVSNRLEDWQHGVFHYEVRVSLISKCTGIVEADGVGSCNSKEQAFREINGHDVANTVLKMAKKRAFIDSILSALRCSDLFTQDSEELEWFSGKYSKESMSSPRATRKQLSYIFSIVEECKYPIEDVKGWMNERYSVYESKQLTVKQASDFIDFLKSRSEQNTIQSKELLTNS